MSQKECHNSLLWCWGVWIELEYHFPWWICFLWRRRFPGIKIIKLHVKAFFYDSCSLDQKPIGNLVDDASIMNKAASTRVMFLSSTMSFYCVWCRKVMIDTLGYQEVIQNNYSLDHEVSFPYCTYQSKAPKSGHWIDILVLPLLLCCRDLLDMYPCI